MLLMRTEMRVGLTGLHSRQLSLGIMTIVVLAVMWRQSAAAGRAIICLV
jgi:hypothetical protein